MTMQDDLYECAKRACKHRYKHSESVMVPEHRPGKPGPKTLPTYRGTCPKCGHSSFYIVKETWFMVERGFWRSPKLLEVTFEGQKWWAWLPGKMAPEGPHNTRQAAMRWAEENATR